MQPGQQERSILRQGLLARFWRLLGRLLGRQDSPWDRAMRLANREAARFNHEYVGTEHLLLGLLAAGAETTLTVLKNLGIDPRQVRREVEKVVQSGPDMVTMGRLPLTPRSLKVVEYATEEAQRLGHARPWTEEMLLGLLREEQGVASQVLMRLGLTLENARDEVQRMLSRDSGWTGDSA